MARIRTIKPEFPQSESMGNVSRDARLTFLQLWTIADDEGRLRGNSRMLSSLLFPYDDDAPALIDSWLEELEREGCIVRYKSSGQAYLQICNWLIHQKIDKPSKSKIPAFDDNSIILSNVRECSSEDQGSRIKDQGSRNKTPHTPQGGRKPAIALQTYLDNCKKSGSKPIPEGHKVFDYVKSAGIPDEFLRLHWLEFKARYCEPNSKRYKSWPTVFEKSVRGGWFRLWYAKDGEYLLTTVGEQARQAHREAA